jgi:hypothetical protein
MSKQLLLALGAGGAAVAAVVASAASIGSVNSTDLGAGTTVVSSCDDDIDVDYTTAFANGAYTVSAVSLAGLSDTCAAQDIKVTLYDDDGDAVGSTSGVVPADPDPLTTTDLTKDLTVSSPPGADVVTGVAVVISG